MVRTPTGARGTEKAAVFEDAVDDADLVEAIEDGDAYGIMTHLETLES